MRVEAFISGDERARRKLQRLAANAEDLRPGWEKVLGQLRQEEIRIFGTRGYGTWPRNSSRTVARKGVDSPLIDTGRLNDALTRKGARGSVGNRTKTRAVFGVNDRVIYWSRFVGKRRPFVVPEDRAERIAVRALIEHLESEND